MAAFIFFVSCVLYLHCVFDMIIRRYPRCRIGYLGGGGGGAYWNGCSTGSAKRRNTRPRQDKGNYWFLSKVLLPFLTPTHLYRSRLLYLERIYIDIDCKREERERGKTVVYSLLLCCVPQPSSIHIDLLTMEAPVSTARRRADAHTHTHTERSVTLLKKMRLFFHLHSYPSSPSIFLPSLLRMKHWDNNNLEQMLLLLLLLFSICHPYPQ